MIPENIFAEIPANIDAEIFDTLLQKGAFKIERIVSRGQASPETGWYQQEHHEWVIVLKGEAIIILEDNTEIHLQTGNYLDIPAGTRHRVNWTSDKEETIWLAVHYPENQ